MKRSKVLMRPKRLFRDRKGATLAVVAALVPVGLGLAGLTVDVGRAYAARQSLKASTQAAALAGAHALGAANANLTSVSTAISTWTSANPPTNVTVTGTTPALVCATATSSLPACNASAANAVTVTRTGTVSTFFLNAFGRSSFTLTATATAAKAGGTAKPLNVMFVIDATGSMGDDDNSCVVPGINTVAGVNSPSRWQCALYSVQSVLKVMPTSLDKVGLMVFPGLTSQYSPTSRPCATQPNSAPYLSANVKYQIHTALDNTYNNGNGELALNSPMVVAVGQYHKESANRKSPCVSNKGGQGSYAAEVIAKAHAALPVVAGTQNVIIFLSDGDFSASATQLNGQTAKVTAQCGQAVTAAQTATAAGTRIYSVSYGAKTSGGCSTGDTYNPCSTMKAIASDPSTFYTTNTSCNVNGSANPHTQLPAIFQAITTSLTKPRLISP
jgi:Flp pilus assembly protein TadG